VSDHTLGSVSDDEVIKLYDPALVMGLLVVANFRVVFGFVVVFGVVVFVVVFVFVCGFRGKPSLKLSKIARLKQIAKSLSKNILSN
jgi:hypothetical protein